MKALILRGKFKGKTAEVSQWCNDWFMLDPRGSHFSEAQEIEVATKPFSPSSLAFTYTDYREIYTHKNNGMLFSWFVGAEAPEWAMDQNFLMTFKKRKHVK